MFCVGCWSTMSVTLKPATKLVAQIALASVLLLLRLPAELARIGARSTCLLTLVWIVG